MSGARDVVASTPGRGSRPGWNLCSLGRLIQMHGSTRSIFLLILGGWFVHPPVDRTRPIEGIVSLHYRPLDLLDANERLRVKIEPGRPKSTDDGREWKTRRRSNERKRSVGR